MVTYPQSRPRTDAPPGPDAEQADEGGDKVSLQAEAAEVGIEVDGRWGVDRLREEIAKAEDDGTGLRVAEGSVKS